MVPLARALAVSYPAGRPCINSHAPPRRWSSGWLITRPDPNSSLKWRSKAAESDNTPPPPLPYTFAASVDAADSAAAGFCIIEGPETVQKELQQIQANIRSRRNRIFLHIEEVRRLRIQQSIKSAELGISDGEPETDLLDFPSSIPFLPPLVAGISRTKNTSPKIVSLPPSHQSTIQQLRTYENNKDNKSELDGWRLVYLDTREQ
ncbi:unnamed protein product [Linum trigynum]|uniref:Uncharacterized protein n=1 Tax=Linum trigynum TaxID=586398 RepID=A0AAV2EYU8_9ROSI